ncbi:hypothetical protein C8J57DRAFT_1233089 [Mycena rebaudengoi]|nr:hypothetical protein C8J57DRAFT_1233089 [Mycena rebaudengoi]
MDGQDILYPGSIASAVKSRLPDESRSHRRVSSATDGEHLRSGEGHPIEHLDALVRADWVRNEEHSPTSDFPIMSHPLQPNSSHTAAFSNGVAAGACIATGGTPGERLHSLVGSKGAQAERDSRSSENPHKPKHLYRKRARVAQFRVLEGWSVRMSTEGGQTNAWICPGVHADRALNGRERRTFLGAAISRDESRLNTKFPSCQRVSSRTGIACSSTDGPGSGERLDARP